MSAPLPAPLPSSGDANDAIGAIPLPDLSKIEKHAAEKNRTREKKKNNNRTGIGRLEPEECIIDNDPKNIDALERVKSF